MPPPCMTPKADLLARQTDHIQTPDCAGFRLDHNMGSQVPLSDHVHSTTARASAERAPD